MTLEPNLGGQGLVRKTSVGEWEGEGEDSEGHSRYVRHWVRRRQEGGM